jgi:hypothetical protein
MTKTSRKWRDKKINKQKGYIKIHNSILAIITGVMAVFFLLSILSADNINRNIVLMFAISTIWLILFGYANNLDCVEVGDE